MADFTQEELLALARAAQMKLPEEDVEHLTMRYNALMESLKVLDQYPLVGDLALPALQPPFEMPASRPAGHPAVRVRTTSHGWQRGIILSSRHCRQADRHDRKDENSRTPQDTVMHDALRF